MFCTKYRYRNAHVHINFTCKLDIVMWSYITVIVYMNKERGYRTGNTMREY